MTKIRTGLAHIAEREVTWKPILSAPFDCDLKVAVLDEGEHALAFPCIKAREGWKDAVTGVVLDIHPTHWCEWPTDL